MKKILAFLLYPVFFLVAIYFWGYLFTAVHYGLVLFDPANITWTYYPDEVGRNFTGPITMLIIILCIRPAVEYISGYKTHILMLILPIIICAEFIVNFWRWISYFPPSTFIIAIIMLIALFHGTMSKEIFRPKRPEQ